MLLLNVSNYPLQEELKKKVESETTLGKQVKTSN